MVSIVPAAITRPCDRTAMRSQTACRLSRSCVTMNTLSPSVRCKVRIKLVELGGADRIEAGGGLVEEDDVGIERERARERHALDHAAGQLGGIFAAHVGVKADHFQLGHRDLLDEPRRQIEIFADRELHVLQRRKRREQRALLEQYAPAPLDRAPLALAERRQGRRRTPRCCRCASATSPMMVRISTDLPAPEPPTKPRISPRKTSSVDVVEHRRAAETDDEVAHADHRCVAAHRSHPDAGEEHGEQAVEHDDEKDRFDHRGGGLEPERGGAAFHFEALRRRRRAR